ncbi:hypothetical protein AX774_g5568 [Zancudomyces culisetae]|uniref:Uncharacterized protein n=1 Tax=Zancudomyces culisetae TaxID=1213189 RepID=A0A1R1PCQ9_ZANCU|nr:hypothetical protein AX774_g7845 [Zancudomyces culisetae]OMH80983.1 hypothetical protein AX774_g5568 [Zancudomyces culisetae]|eukprot:OMH78757.1 hypothetical protein AX774_g7845 [Zancudomyces culisetae]
MSQRCFATLTNLSLPSSRNAPARKLKNTACFCGNLTLRFLTASATIVRNSSLISAIKLCICPINRSTDASFPVFNNVVIAKVATGLLLSLISPSISTLHTCAASARLLANLSSIRIAANRRTVLFDPKKPCNTLTAADSRFFDTPSYSHIARAASKLTISVRLRRLSSNKSSNPCCIPVSSPITLTAYRTINTCAIPFFSTAPPPPPPPNHPPLLPPPIPLSPCTIFATAIRSCCFNIYCNPSAWYCSIPDPVVAAPLLPPKNDPLPPLCESASCTSPPHRLTISLAFHCKWYADTNAADDITWFLSTIAPFKNLSIAGSIDTSVILHSALIALARYISSDFGWISFINELVTIITSSDISDSSLIAKYTICLNDIYFYILLPPLFSFNGVSLKILASCNTADWSTVINAPNSPIVYNHIFIVIPSPLSIS